MMASNNKTKKTVEPATEPEQVPAPVPAVATALEPAEPAVPDVDEFGNARVEYEPFSGYYSIDGFGRTVYVVRGLDLTDFATALQDVFGKFRVTVLSTGQSLEDEFDSTEAVREYIRSEFFHDVVLPSDDTTEPTA